MAGVNRPYEDKEGRRKPTGFILDFVEIFEKLEDALAFDSDEVSVVVTWLNVLKKRFEDLIGEGKESYLPI
jgi:type I restriction enzyme, R subunit